MDKEQLKKKGFHYNAYEWQAWRPLTFAERKVNLVWLKKTMTNLWNDLVSKLQKYWQKLISGTLSKKDQEEMVAIVTAISKEAFEYWKKTASWEVGKKTPPTSKEISGAIEKQNQKIIQKIVKDAKKKLKEEKKKEFSEEGIMNQILNWLKTFFVISAINTGRKSVLEWFGDDIYAYQYSAILDWRTTDICKGLDWMVVKPWSSLFDEYSPPNHWNCRSIWVAIMSDEAFKPWITDEDTKAETEKPDFKDYYGVEEFK